MGPPGPMGGSKFCFGGRLGSDLPRADSRPPGLGQPLGPIVLEVQAKGVVPFVGQWRPGRSAVSAQSEPKPESSVLSASRRYRRPNWVNQTAPRACCGCGTSRPVNRSTRRTCKHRSALRRLAAHLAAKYFVS